MKGLKRYRYWHISWTADRFAMCLSAVIFCSNSFARPVLCSATFLALTTLDRFTNKAQPSPAQKDGYIIRSFVTSACGSILHRTYERLNPTSLPPIYIHGPSAHNVRQKKQALSKRVLPVIPRFPDASICNHPRRMVSKVIHSFVLTLKKAT